MTSTEIEIPIKIDKNDLVSNLTENMGSQEILDFILDLDLAQQDTSFTVDLLTDLIRSLKDESPSDIEKIKMEIFK